MNQTLTYINEHYGKYIWAAALRYNTGIWSPEDVFQEILLGIDQAVAEHKFKISQTEKVHSYIISRSINIVRKENKRKCKLSIPIIDETNEMIEFEIPSSVSSLALTNFEIDVAKEWLYALLDEQIAKFFLELAFPSPDTQMIAATEQNTKRNETGLKMNIHELKILPKHVAIYMALGGEIPPSPATISRWRKKAQEAINEEDQKEST